MNKLLKLAAPILLLSLVPAQAAQAATLHPSGHEGRTAHAVHTDDSWDHKVDHRHDRFEAGYYWRVVAGIRARWNATDDRWEREVGHHWQHWNGHRWVA